MPWRNGFGLEKGGVVAGMGVSLAIGNLDDAGRDDVEEVTVVGDEDDSAAVGFEEVLQPADGLGVEVVGGLVEEEEIGLDAEGPAEGNAAFFSAGEGTGFGFEWWSSKGVGKGVDAGVEIPSLGVLDEGEQFVEFGFGAVAIFIAGDRFDNICCASGDVVIDREGGIDFEFLREVANAKAAAFGDVAGISLVLIGDDFEEGSFSTAVAPDKADFFASGDGEGDAVEKSFGGRRRGGVRWQKEGS